MTGRLQCCHFVMWKSTAKLIPVALTYCVLVRSFASPASRTLRSFGNVANFSRTACNSAKANEHDSLSRMIAKELLLDKKRNSSKIDNAIESLLASVMDQDNSDQTKHDATAKRSQVDLQRLRGLYEVSYVKTIRKGENPVGGKWTRRDGLAQKLFRSRRSFQHILGINETGRGRETVTTKTGKRLEVLGEAVNVISLETLWGLIRATIILRGDVVCLAVSERNQPHYNQVLSYNAIRALFDPPRLVFGKRGKLFNISVGPRTSVVLDTPFVDGQIRIGLGGRSGTRFVFRRCSPDDVEANEFRELLYRKPLRKLWIVALCGCMSFAAAIQKSWFGSTIAGTSLLIGLLMGFSGGGIERGDSSISESKQVYGQ